MIYNTSRNHLKVIRTANGYTLMSKLDPKTLRPRGYYTPFIIDVTRDEIEAILSSKGIKVDWAMFRLPEPVKYHKIVSGSMDIVNNIK